MRGLFLIATGCAALLACAPPPLGGALPEAPVAPANVAGFSESTLTASDGLHLQGRAWRPSGTPRAAVVIVHGLRDHGERYAELARELNRRSIAVYAMDLRGHGRSEGRRVSVDRLARYVDDLGRFLAEVRRNAPGQPLFLLGHSMGGTVAALYAETPGARLDGLVLSAPALQLYVSELEVCGASLLADLAPNAPQLSLDMTLWSRRREVIEQNLHDPLVYQADAPVATAVALLEGAAEALADAPLARVPLLVMHGTADGITDPAGSAAFVKASRSSDKALRLYPGLYHDLWHEPEREKLAFDLASWLVDHLPKTAVDGAESDEPATPDTATAETPHPARFATAPSRSRHWSP